MSGEHLLPVEPSPQTPPQTTTTAVPRGCDVEGQTPNPKLHPKPTSPTHRSDANSNRSPLKAALQFWETRSPTGSPKCKQKKRKESIVTATSKLVKIASTGAADVVGKVKARIQAARSGSGGDAEAAEHAAATRDEISNHIGRESGGRVVALSAFTAAGPAVEIGSSDPPTANTSADATSPMRRKKKVNLPPLDQFVFGVDETTPEARPPSVPLTDPCSSSDGVLSPVLVRLHSYSHAQALAFTSPLAHTSNASSLLLLTLLAAFRTESPRHTRARARIDVANASPPALTNFPILFTTPKPLPPPTHPLPPPSWSRLL